MEIRVNVDGTKAALRTGPSITAGEWFIFDANRGGYYSDGVRDNVADWTTLEGSS